MLSGRGRLNLLKKELDALLPCDHVRRYRAVWQGDHPEWNLDRFCEDVRRDLQQIIDQEIALFKQQPDLIREVEAHWEFAQDRCYHFVGRQDILQRIHNYLASDDTAPLIIHGKSGSGKTALMARAWLDMPSGVGDNGNYGEQPAPVQEKMKKQGRYCHYSRCD